MQDACAGSSTGNAAAAVELRQLADDFPRWRIWRTTDAGTWWASRRGPGWNTEPRTVAGDTAGELREELRCAERFPLQEALASHDRATARALGAYLPGA